MENPTEQESPPSGSDTAVPNGGIVYILTNEAMPGYIKIGKTAGYSPDDVQGRMKELYGPRTTGVPLPFDCKYAAVVANYGDVETKLHEVFKDYRINRNREFFKDVPLVSAIAALQLAGGRDVTPTDAISDTAEERKTEESRRPPFTFSMVGLEPGAELEFIRDHSKVCKAEDDRRVRFEDKVTALSPLTKELLGYAWSPAGPDYWAYNEETLSERRRRLEREALEREPSSNPSGSQTPVEA